VAEAKQRLAAGSTKLENARAAAAALLISDAWVEGLQHEVQLARVELEIAELESQHHKGLLAEGELEAKLLRARMKLDALQNKHAEWRVRKLRGLAQSGAVAQRELTQAESELELSRLAMKLSDLQRKRAEDQITPQQYEEEYGKIVARQSRLAREAAQAELNHMRQMFAAGMVNVLDVQWAELELADAEDRGRSAAIEAAGALGKISWELADVQLASLWVEGATRRVQYLTGMVRDCDKGVKLGLVDEELLRSCREDYEQAERELAEARKGEKEAKARLGQ
jgi:hypothetical protein